MTEAEWLARDDPTPMLSFLQGGASGRKWRLFACAIARRLPLLLAELPTRHAIELAEAYADGRVGHPDVSSASEKVQLLLQDAILRRDFDRACTLSYAWRASAPAAEDVVRVECHFHEYAPEHGHLIRDIFGNPFRPVAFSSEWRTDTAVSLARQMYESRDFSAMPILADALQDAGCDSDDILNHCRGEGPHVRGCWVVDVILGNE
jgi:hypothetical protein